MSTFDLTRLLPADHFSHALRHDVQRGLTASPKWLPPKWFYDARGSELFEEITRLDEYYPTRTETAILRDHAGRSRHSAASGRSCWSMARAPASRPRS